MGKTDIFMKAEVIFRARGGILRTSEAIELGVHPRTLYAMRSEGWIVELARGLYRLAKFPDLKSPDLAIVASKCPGGVICLISALSFHGVTTQIPHQVDVALMRGRRPPRITYPPIRVFRFGKEAFGDGIETHTIDHVTVRVYSVAKTIADCFKFRNRIGIDVAVEALKLSRERRKATPAKIMEYARICRVERVIQPYLEAMI
ncbi:MAG: type IV toxin-antitoxin system AbiEi family antitoxin domain-containing protein [Pseudomonadota bacterium]